MNSINGLHEDREMNIHCYRQRLSGFTLIELMIVVVIISILAAVAVPSYSDYVARGKITDGLSALASYRVRVEQYFQDNRSYQDAGGNCAVAMPATRYFSYQCVSPSTTTYTITSTATDAQLVGLSYTVDQSNNRTTGSVPSGWSLPATNNCWALSKSGNC